MEDLEPMNDNKILADTQADPMQDAKGAAPQDNAEMPSASIRSHVRQCKMSRAMAKLVSQQDFYRNTNIALYAIISHQPFHLTCSRIRSSPLQSVIIHPCMLMT